MKNWGGGCQLWVVMFARMMKGIRTSSFVNCPIGAGISLRGRSGGDVSSSAVCAEVSRAGSMEAGPGALAARRRKTLPRTKARWFGVERGRVVRGWPGVGNVGLGFGSTKKFQR